LPVIAIHESSLHSSTGTVLELFTDKQKAKVGGKKVAPSYLSYHSS